MYLFVRCVSLCIMYVTLFVVVVNHETRFGDLISIYYYGCLKHIKVDLFYNVFTSEIVHRHYDCLLKYD
jgi:hypothetical protein